MTGILIAAVIIVLLSGGAPAVARDGKGSAGLLWERGKSSGQASSGNASKPRQAKAPETIEKKEPEELIWTGQSEGFQIRWTTADIQAKPQSTPDQIAFSASSLANQGLETFLPDAKSLIRDAQELKLDKAVCSYIREFTLLSVVGPLVSFKDEQFSFCRGCAHPNVEIRFTTIDLTKSGQATYVNPPLGGFLDLGVTQLGKVVQLTDYFPEQEVLKALLGDPVIRKALQKTYGTERPRTLKGLYMALKEQYIWIQEDAYELRRDFLTRFAFHHIEGNKVAIRLHLPAAVRRGHYTQLGLLLPIPESLRQPLRLAATRQAGFLTKDQERISRHQKTEVVFEIFDTEIRKEQLIWSGVSGGLKIRWTTFDLQARSLHKPEQLLFDAGTMAIVNRNRHLKELGDETGNCDEARKFQLLSVVGPLVGIEDYLFSDCEGQAHPAHGARFATIDLAKPGEIPDLWPAVEPGKNKTGKVVRLTDYFSEKEILNALLADPLIRQTLDKMEKPRPPGTLGSFYELLKDQIIEPEDSDSYCTFYFPSDFLTRFVFHHVEQDKVAVLMGLPHYAEVCRGEQALLKLLLPIPASLKKALNLAALGQKGFLMLDQEKIARGLSTTVILATRTDK